MKKILPGSASSTKRKLDRLPRLYIICLWARYASLECYFSGKCTSTGVPLVYHYNDHNGTADHYDLIPINYVSSGAIDIWTTNKFTAEALAKKLNKLANLE